jgi:pimeloyl-ACP methyl ester carboxylesterase
MTLLDPGAGLTERLVTLPDGRRLRTVVAGEGDGPLVVFEAGMSAPAASWAHTQREISAHARTLSYDRAGYGGSDVDPHDRTLERIVDDLTALLDALGETAPVVLVGHSWGGPVLRLFADRHPERVAGLVFVDATVVEVLPPRSARLIARSFAVQALLLRVGGKGLVRKATIPRGMSSEISAADVDVLERDYLCVSAMRAGGREARHIVAALPTMRRLQDTGTPPVPTVCVQAGHVDRGMAKIRPVFNETAARLMAAVPEGRVVVVEDAGHLVPQEQPAAVRDVVLDVLAAAKAGRR